MSYGETVRPAVTPLRASIFVSLLVVQGCGSDTSKTDYPPIDTAASNSGAVSSGGAGSGGTGTDTAADDGGTDTTGGQSGEPPVVQVPGSSLSWFDALETMTHAEAQSLCESAEVGGLSNWRLPKIQEFYPTVIDCDSHTQGLCPVSDPGCLEEVCNMGMSCTSCMGSGACHYDTGLWGTSCGEHEQYWSSSICTDCPVAATYVWTYAFSTPLPVTLGSVSSASVRCVHD